MRTLSVIVTGYMLFALVWWMVLLFKKNNQNYQYSCQIISLHSKLSSDYDADTQLLKAKTEAESQQKMILGEAIVFGLALLMGIYLIQKAHQSRLRASEQQNNFLLAVTHELKSPLTAIKMGLQTLHKQKIPEEAKAEIITDAETETKRLETLINNLLLVNKLGYQYEFRKEKVEMSDFMSQISVYVSRVKKPGEFTINTNSNAVMTVDGDALHIVMTNLIDNAIKYAPQSAIEITSSSDAINAYFTVADQGNGIEIGDRQDVFKKFYRLGPEQTRKTKGTGLGLYIVKQIVEGHRGTITLKENKPQGCKFVITIPKDN